MIASRLQSQADEAWDVIEAATKKGLGPSGKRDSDKICPAVTLPSTTWRRDAPGPAKAWTGVPKSSAVTRPPRVDRLQRTGRIYFGVTHRFALDARQLEALAANDPDLVKTLRRWAGQAADFQSAMSLKHLIGRGAQAEVKSAEEEEVEQPPSLAEQLARWAESEPSRRDVGYRLVVTTGEKVQEAPAWVTDQVAPGVSGYGLGRIAVLLPMNEAGTIREQAFDLTLTWEPASGAEGSLDLVLEERFAFRDPRNAQGVPILFSAPPPSPPAQPPSAPLEQS
ncbi:MAG: hypothetical protein GY788_09910 [bacterium]|nr:hypothetical protein [bacterium]